MKWTTDKPVEPGYYWMRRPRLTDVVVDVYMRHDGLRVAFEGMDLKLGSFPDHYRWQPVQPLE